PSLRERREDIPALIQDLASRISHGSGLPARTFSGESLLTLQAYDWPGNIRQLRNVIEWTLIMASDKTTGSITPDLLPGEISGETPALLRSDQSTSIMSMPLRE